MIWAKTKTEEPADMYQEVAQISDRCAGLLQDDIFSTTLGTVNTRTGAANRVIVTTDTSTMEQEGGLSSVVELKDRFPAIPDMPLEGGGSNRVRFEIPALRRRGHCPLPHNGVQDQCPSIFQIYQTQPQRKQSIMSLPQMQ